MADAQGGVAADAGPAAGEGGKCHDVAVQTRELERLRTGERPLADLAAMRATAHAALSRQTQTLVLELTTITPVYGGGTRPGEVDLLVPFRPRAIKNGIRHWWWMLNRHAPEYRVAATDDATARRAKKQVLYDAMVSIWGGAGREGEELAAKVSVEVSAVKGVKVAPYAAYRVVAGDRGFRLQDDSRDPWLYALFGARGERDPQANVQRVATPWVAAGATFAERYATSDVAALVGEQRHLFKSAPDSGPDARKSPSKLMVPGARFTLVMRLGADLEPGQSEQVRLALAFWLTFGGIGARTSRGLGRTSWPRDSFDAWALVEKHAQGGDRGVRLVESGVFTPTTARRPPNRVDPTAEHAMLWLLGAYRNFRQSRNRLHSNNPGRSHWRKAEAVRDATHRRAHLHTPLAPMPDGFSPIPEMLFGAPIVVSFNTRGNSVGDPEATVELTFVDPDDLDHPLNRYTSPLSFGVRPLEQDGESGWQPCLAILDQTADFTGRKLSVRIKEAGRTGTLQDIPAGRWWIDFDSPDAAVSHRVLAAHFAPASWQPSRRSAESLLDAFAKQVEAGDLDP